MNTFGKRIAAAGAAVLAASAPCALSDSSALDLGEIGAAGPAAPAVLGATDRADGDAIELRGGVDLADAAALLPGVTPGRDADLHARTIRVRGFDLNQAPLFLDGIPAGPPGGDRMDLARFGLLDASEASVSRGFSPLAFGPNTLGGAINVVSRKPVRPRELLLRGGAFSGNGLEGGARGGMVHARGFLQGGVAYRERDYFSVSEDHEPAAGEDGDRRENSDSRDLQLHLKGAWTPVSGDEIAVGFVRQDSEFGVPPYTGDDARVQPRYWRYPSWERNSLYLVGRKTLGLNAYLKPRLFYTTFEDTLESYDDDAYITQAGPLAFTSHDDDESLGGSIEAGVLPGQQRAPRITAHYRQDTHREHVDGGEESEFSDDTIAVSAEDAFRFRESWTLALGLGYEQYENRKAEDRSGAAPRDLDGGDDSAVNPQIGLFFSIPGGAFRATFARKSRFPSLGERYASRGGTALPNPDLETETADHFEAGYAGLLNERVEGRVSAFYSRVSDAIQRVDFAEFDEATGTWLHQVRNVGDAEHRGAEAGIAWPGVRGAWKLGLDYAWLEVENTSNPDLKPIGAPEHRLVGYAELKPTPKWTFVPSVEYSSSRYATSDGVEVDGFWAANLHARVTLPRNFTLDAGVQNVFDEDYELAEGYPEEGRNYYANVSYRF